MTFNEFDNFQAALLKEVVQMKDTKGKEYASDNDRFANFNEDAKDNGIDRLAAAGMHLNKQMRAIKAYIRTKHVFSDEPPRKRIVDAITYLTLIAGMIEEDEQQKLTKSTNGKPYYQCNYCEFKSTNKHILDLHEVTCGKRMFPLEDMNVGKHQPFEFDPSPSKPINQFQVNDPKEVLTLNPHDVCSLCHLPFGIHPWYNLRHTLKVGTIVKCSA